MLEKVKEGDLAIFKNGEETRIIHVSRDHDIVALGFDEPVICTKDLMPSRWWAFKYNGEWNVDVEDRNDIVKIIHIEKDDVS